MAPRFDRRRRAKLGPRIVAILAMAAVAFWLLLFLPAGTFRWWAAWGYLGMLAVPMAVIVGYFARYDPGLLERRLHHREQETTQRWIQIVFTSAFAAGYVIPALDYRYGWSSVPLWAIVVADAAVLAGYLFVFAVFRENSWASRTVEVAKGQRVISTGPYAVVRHPMYVGVSLMYIATPVALGSWWGLLPMLTMPIAFVIRVRNEEEVLLRGLPGYAAYRRKVRWRLFPGVW